MIKTKQHFCLLFVTISTNTNNKKVLESSTLIKIRIRTNNDAHFVTVANNRTSRDKGRTVLPELDNLLPHNPLQILCCQRHAPVRRQESSLIILSYTDKTLPSVRPRQRDGPAHIRPFHSPIQAKDEAWRSLGI